MNKPQAIPVEAPADYPFPKGQDGLLSWAKALQQLQESRNYWLATVRSDGRPHVAPLWGVWLDNRLYFEGSPDTRWARNLAANPAASVNLESGLDVVIAEGTSGQFRLEPELRDRLRAAWAEKYGMYGPREDTEEMFRFLPRVVRAWGQTMEDGARWILDS